MFKFHYQSYNFHVKSKSVLPTCPALPVFSYSFPGRAPAYKAVEISTELSLSLSDLVTFPAILR